LKFLQLARALATRLSLCFTYRRQHTREHGAEELIAGSARQYRDIAVALATDTERFKCLRAGLRERMARSSNIDGGAYTSELEEIYREMWNEWCKSSSIQ
jgi:predicted O-linked N-acetylglucosamine transferase (SPINDLY family)